MGSSGNFDCNHKLNHITVYFLFLLISSSTQLRFTAGGRPINIPTGHFQEEKAMLRAQIGSRPPKCERRCSSCGPCEAIQVPTNPQTKFGGKNSSLSIPTIEYARGGDDSSNYKPMSWKCKCGNSIFNP
ncbi:EPIDERMAL PATTERNING FACTOR-like protein 2 [Rhododendron vialii]|uniref:EPIDERMAL PATTERNING FACTOR-like protein 2 n=1 Tax=Rhododendron vialii TaxID=182163 RepID=UPI00265EA878|nr:EPIDERMAL PATTERNING FACTOR-like protein 2 [Rhododendron vialii]